MRRARIKGVRRRRGVTCSSPGGLGATAAVPLALSPLTGYLLVLTGAAFWTRRADATSRRSATGLRRDSRSSSPPTTKNGSSPQHCGACTRSTTPTTCSRSMSWPIIAPTAPPRSSGLPASRFMSTSTQNPLARDRRWRGCASRLDERGSRHDVVVVIDADSIVDPRVSPRVRREIRWGRPRRPGLLRRARCREVGERGSPRGGAWRSGISCGRSAGTRSGPRAAFTATAWRLSPTCCDDAR